VCWAAVPGSDRFSSALLHPWKRPTTTGGFGRDRVGAWLVSACLKFCTRTKGTWRWFTWFENELQCKAEPKLSPLLRFVVPFLY